MSPTSKPPEELRRQVVAVGDQAIGVEADLSKVSDLQMGVDRTAEALGRLYILPNKAGIESPTRCSSTTEAQYDKIMAIDVKSALIRNQFRSGACLPRAPEVGLSTSGPYTRTGPMSGNAPSRLSNGGDAHPDPASGLRTGSGQHSGGGSWSPGGGRPYQLRRCGTGDDEAPLRRHSGPPHGPARGDRGAVVAFLAGHGASFLVAATHFVDRDIIQLQPRAVDEVHGVKEAPVISVAGVADQPGSGAAGRPATSVL